MYWYRLLHVGPLRRQYALKLLSVAFLGIHVPLVGLVAFVLATAHPDPWPILGLTLLLTLLATAATLFFLHRMLEPLRRTQTALRDYRLDRTLPGLPRHYEDEIGLLMRDLNAVVDELDGTLRQKNRLLANLRQRNRALTHHLDEARHLECFEYLASHDLQEPLRDLLLDAQWLKRHLRDRFDGPSEAALKRMQAAGSRLRQHFRGLIELAGLPSRVQRHPVDLATVWAAAWNAVPGLPEPAHRLPDTLPSVPGAPRLLQRVFEAVLDNAVRFRHPDRPLDLRITAHHDAHYVHLQILDNGQGFDPACRERVFAMFERLDGHAHDGIGLGLAISREIVQRHGGMISADAEPGRGAAILIHLPHRRAPEPPAAGRGPSAEGRRPAVSGIRPAAVPPTRS